MVTVAEACTHDVVALDDERSVDRSLRSLRRRLAAGRGGVVCDLTACLRLDPDIATELMRLQREVGWLDAELVVAGASGDVLQTLDDAGALQQLSSYADLDGALASVPPPGEAFEAQVRLAPHAVSVRTARQFVRKAMRNWSVRPDVAEDAMVVTTELVTNALIHAGTDLEVHLQLTQRSLNISVRDGVREEVPRIIDEQPGDEAGRGLRVVKRLSRAWGYEEVGVGKEVWASLARGAGGPLTTA